jgi:hypothetical protein
VQGFRHGVRDHAGGQRHVRQLAAERGEFHRGYSR